jgi:hypothetical protein
MVARRAGAVRAQDVHEIHPAASRSHIVAPATSGFSRSSRSAFAMFDACHAP